MDILFTLLVCQLYGLEQVEKSLFVTGFGYEHDEPWATNIELFKEFTDISRVGLSAILQILGSCIIFPFEFLKIHVCVCVGVVCAGS